MQLAAQQCWVVVHTVKFQKLEGGKERRGRQYVLKCMQWWIAYCGYRCLNELPSIDRTETFFPPMSN